jgi:NhaP-type Na+/H+ or K+/H+ antiporter
MLLLLYPILARIGYGMTWQNMMIMMWGGLRGAVGICLALEVYRHEVFCSDKLMGSKVSTLIILSIVAKLNNNYFRCCSKPLELYLLL